MKTAMKKPKARLDQNQETIAALGELASILLPGSRLAAKLLASQRGREITGSAVNLIGVLAHRPSGTIRRACRALSN